jgi:hypothetical protein
MDSSVGEAFYYGNEKAEQIMHFKSENQDLERKLSDALSKYDKDIALWEGKCQFLQN